MTKKKIDDLFFRLFCEKNSDGTLHLRLKGNELIQRIGRRLGKDDMYKVAKFLKENPKVVSLDLAYNNLTDDGIKILTKEYFEEKNNLEYLNVIHCDFHADGMEWLSSAKYINLRSIRMVGNKIGGEGARFIGRLIEKCVNLEALDIGQTDQVLDSIESLLIALEKSQLKYLNISRIIPKSYYTQYSSTTLADDVQVLLKTNRTLQELRIQKCDFDGHDIEILLGGLLVHTNLSMLDLAANKLADHGAILLSKWLKTRPNLLALRIPSNEIGTSGAQALGYSMPYSKLRMLDIHNNKIGDQGMCDLINVLKKPTQLRMLFMWGNTLNDRALTKIEMALKAGVLDQEYIDVKIYYVDGRKCGAYYPTNSFRTNVLWSSVHPVLFCEKNSDGTRHLRLKGNELIRRVGKRLGKDDMYELAKFLKKTPEVISIDLAYNDLADDGLKILTEEIFEEENNIQYLNLLHCDIHAEGMRALSSAKHLNLKNIRLVGNKLGADGARFIGRLIENCPNLEGLDIGQTDQVLESIESLLMAFEKSSLKYLNISRIIPNSYYTQYNNSNLADDVQVLLKINTTLKELQVQKCDFDGHDVAILLRGLREHTNLSILDLAANRIADGGACLLAEWLRERPNLIALRISANQITTVGARALALNVPFSRVRLLDVHKNRIGDEGISDLIDSLKKSTQIRMLYIWGNQLGQMALTKIETALQSGVLNQEYIDVKVYRIDGYQCSAYYPTNHFKQKAYCVSGCEVLPDLKIIKNKIAHPDAQPRALIQVKFHDRYPPVDESLGLKIHRTNDG